MGYVWMYSGASEFGDDGRKCCVETWLLVEVVFH